MSPTTQYLYVATKKRKPANKGDILTIPPTRQLTIWIWAGRQHNLFGEKILVPRQIQNHIVCSVVNVGALLDVWPIMGGYGGI